MMFRKNRKAVLMLILVLVASLFLAACGSGGSSSSSGGGGQTDGNRQSGGSGEKFTLVFADYMPPTHFISQNGHQEWIKRVQELTNNRVEISYYPSGQLASAQDIMDLVRNGGADIGNTAQGYVAGKLPLTGVVSLPGLTDKADVAGMAATELLASDLMLNSGFLENGIRPLYAYTSPPAEIFTKVPIRTMDDLKGLKIRVPGGITENQLSALGATPISMAEGELYQAIQRGTIDGTFMVAPGVVGNKLYEVLSYGTVGSGGSVILLFTFISNNTWEKLPDDIKAAMNQATMEIAEKIGTITVEQLVRDTEELKKQGMEFIEVDKNLFTGAVQSVNDEWIQSMKEKGLPVEESVDLFVELLKKYDR